MTTLLRTGWWAERPDDGDHEVATPEYPWVPTLQTDGSCLSLPVAFATEEQCVHWIEDNVLDVGLLDDTLPDRFPAVPGKERIIIIDNPREATR